MTQNELHQMEEYNKLVQQRNARRKAKRKKQLIQRLTIMGVSAVLLLSLFIVLIVKIVGGSSKKNEIKTPEEITDLKYNDIEPELDVQLLDINEYSRPGTAIGEIKGIVVHYTANPGSTAQQNRDYFEGLSQSGSTYASSHFIIGLDGEIVQCVPCNEIAYASNSRNEDTISIECCYQDESGKFNGNTYETLISLVTWLMGRYDLSVDDVIRHYDVTGKNCPKYFVENEDAWDKFKSDLLIYIDKNGAPKSDKMNDDSE